MPLKLFTSREQQRGTPPGTLVVPTDHGKTAGPPRLTVMAYHGAELRETQVVDLAAMLAALPTDPGVTWLNVDGIGDIATLTAIGEALHLHPLTMEDVLTPDQRPKMDLGEGYLYLVVKMLSLSPEGRLDSEQVSFVLGKQYLITFQEREGDVFGIIRERLRRRQGRVRQAGADYLAYALLDAIVDHYFLVLEHYSEKLEELDEQVMVNSGAATLHAVHQLKRELAGIRRVAWPLRDLIAGLERSDSPLLHRSTRPYVRDLYDNVVHIIDTIEIFREMASGLLDVHLSVISNRMNEVMKVLTLITTIFIPVTFLASIYGMNFSNMPAQTWTHGYLVIYGAMALTIVGMLTWFRLRKWL